MVILAFYGIHRYQLVWLYYRNRRREAKSSEPAAHFTEAELPFVTIQLPIYNEQFVIDRLLDACCRLDYPRDRFEIQLLDDSTDETVAVASATVARFADGTQGLEPQPVHYLHRSSLSSTPTSFPRRSGCGRSCTTSPSPASAWCRPAGRT